MPGRFLLAMAALCSLSACVVADEGDQRDRSDERGYYERSYDRNTDHDYDRGAYDRDQHDERHEDQDQDRDYDRH